MINCSGSYVRYDLVLIYSYFWTSDEKYQNQPDVSQMTNSTQGAGDLVMQQQPGTIRMLTDILPEEPLLMMGAGPVPIPAAVAHANSIVINHLGDSMVTVVEQVKTMSGYVFQSRTARILGVAGPGSAAMEMAVANLLEPGDKCLSICNGYFSQRLAEMADRLGGEVVRHVAPERESVDADVVRALLEKHQPQVITIVQGETSSTVCNRQLPLICEAAREFGCLIVVDAVCTLSTMPLQMEAWGIDAVITGGQKGLSSIPGVSLVAFSERAWKKRRTRKAPISHWCLDALLADRFWYGKSYHYTAPVSGVLALHEALRLVCSETLPVRFHRHRRSSSALQQGIEACGLKLYVDSEHRLDSVIGIELPEKIDATELLKLTSSRYRVEISGSFGAPIVRIGQMGEQCRSHNVFRAFHALGSSLSMLGAELDVPTGMSVLERSLAELEQSLGEFAAHSPIEQQSA